MKRAIIIIVLCSSLSFLFSEAKISIAIMDFEAKGSESSEASIIGDLFRDFVFGTRKFTVVDRISMEAILTEQNLQQALGCTTEECAVQVGKILGVNYTIIGTLGKLGNVYIVSVRMVNIENAEIEWTKSERVNSFNEIEYLIRDLVIDLVKTVFDETIEIEMMQKRPKIEETVEDTKQKTAVLTLETPEEPHRFPSVGIDIQLGFPIIRKFYMDHDIRDISFSRIKARSTYLNFQIGAYHNLLYLGFQSRTFKMRKGEPISIYSDLQTYESEWEGSTDAKITDLILASRFGSIGGFTLTYLMWRFINYEYKDFISLEEKKYHGPGIGLQFRVGSPFPPERKYAVPVAFLFDLGFNISYLFFDRPDTWASDDPFCFSISGNLGIGLMIKKFGPYVMLVYDVDSTFEILDEITTGYNFNNFYHGLTFRVGVNFDLQAFF